MAAWAQKHPNGISVVFRRNESFGYPGTAAHLHISIGMRSSDVRSQITGCIKTERVPIRFRISRRSVSISILL